VFESFCIDGNGDLGEKPTASEGYRGVETKPSASNEFYDYFLKIMDF